MSKFETCIDCNKQSPETETDYTLIGAQFGWRLTRAPATDGSLHLEWRCPTCWIEYKRSHGPGEASRSSSTPPPESVTRPLAGGTRARRATELPPLVSPRRGR